MPSLREAALKAIEIYATYAEATSFDAGSGTPPSSRPATCWAYLDAANEDHPMKKTKKPPQPLDDAALIKDYPSWPRWPFLPLKRRTNSLQDNDLGVLLATQEHDDAVKGKAGSTFRVYHVYMFKPPKSKAEWAAAPKTEYPTLDALLADGWVVD